jgi:hypothetical protein
MTNDQDKWASFETNKEPTEPELPGWLDWLCRVFFATAGLGLVFGTCGGLLWILPYRYGGAFGSIGRQFALGEETWMAWSRFFVGGVIGVVIVVRWWRRPSQPCRTRIDEKAAGQGLA